MPRLRNSRVSNTLQLFGICYGSIDLATASLDKLQESIRGLEKTIEKALKAIDDLSSKFYHSESAALYAADVMCSRLYNLQGSHCLHHQLAPGD